MKVRLDYSDGTHYMAEVEPENVARFEELGHKLLDVPDDIWEAYIKFLDEGNAWNAFIVRVENELNDPGYNERMYVDD